MRCHLLMKCLLVGLLLLRVSAANSATWWVATDGSDATGDGSQGSPWASITHAVDQASGGDEVIVRPGTYNGRQSLRVEFETPVLVRSEIPYAARLRHDSGAALIAYTGRNVIVEGFDIAHAPNNTGALVIQIQDLLGAENGSGDGSDPVVSDIVLRNNIIHSSTNNDLLKINNGAERIRVEGNLFFNQSGSDEHIDINSVIDVVVEDNVFMNTSARPSTSSFVVIKDSNGSEDSVLGAQQIIVRRNVFLNWYGNGGQGFLRLGEDGTPNFEVIDALIENNLMLGNSPHLMRSPLTIQGSRDVVFRNNTLHGDMPSRSFAGRLIAGPDNPRNQNLLFINNVYADPTGSMGSEAFAGVDLFDAPADQTDSATLDRNLYYNGGLAIPVDAGQFLDFNDDARAIVADPGLADPAALVPPVWDGTDFADGSNSIRGVFVRLVERFATPADGSPLIDAADPAASPTEDILGSPRDAAPDLGALEWGAAEGLLFRDRFEASALRP
ncbi:hypothetical protein HNQ63_001089 [Wenzhouxiangella marina]|uniref:Uncharacterized protein n=3 Tax=Wenzhouxiangella marina TaxID=1579979 RepID=A0A0K0XV52_9GAMM|nr:hypothetical protein WM2015_1215 [Wenzhouxiangella marina]MBB6086652.1 hypothetical protein [Wenzhouxiangella marina]